MTHRTSLIQATLGLLTILSPTFAQDRSGPPASPYRLLESGRETLDDPAATALRGRIVTADGRPVAGATLYLRIEPRFEHWHTETDVDGRFEFAAFEHLRSLRVRATERSADVLIPLDLRLEPGVAEVREFAISAGGSVSGRVVALDGTPIAGAEVLGWCLSVDEVLAGQPPLDPHHSMPVPHRRTTSDEDGSFRLDHLGFDYTIGGAAPGMTHVTPVRGTCCEGEHDRGTSLILVPEVRLTGVVFLRDGTPGSGLEVSVLTEEESWRSERWHREARIREDDLRYSCRRRLETDEAGAFATTLPRGWSYSVTVTAPGHARQRLTWHPDDGELEVRLAGGHGLRGVVRARGGEPLENAWLLYSQDRSQWYDCDRIGRFEITGLSDPDPYHDHPALLLRARGHAIQVVELDEDPANWPEFLELELEPERVIAGRVVDAAGQPVPGAKLVVTGDRELRTDSVSANPPTWERIGRLNETTSDDDGSFRFGGLYPGAFRLEATGPGSGERVASFTVDFGTTGLQVRLGPPRESYAVFQGRVLDGLTGEPIPMGSVSVMRPTGKMAAPVTKTLGEGPLGMEITMSFSFTDSWVGDTTSLLPDGSFRTWTHPGKLEVKVSAPGYVPQTMTRGPQEVGLHDFGTIALHRAVSVRFRVIDDQGRPEPGKLRCTTAGGETLQLYRNEALTQHSDERQLHPPFLSMEKGPIHGLPATRITVHFQPTGSSASYTYEVDLSGPVDDRVVLRFPPRAAF